jgi:phosphonate transport system substrate-binding protein
VNRIVRVLSGAAAAALLVVAGAAEPEPLILAVHPYLPAPELLARFTPLAQALGKAVGRPIDVRVGRSYEEHIGAIGNDSVDIAYMGPTPYVTLVAKYGPKPILARQVVHGDPMVHGVIVVRQDSPVQSLAQLQGRRFAFGDPQSTTGHILASAMLLQAGVPESALAGHGFLGSHMNVALAVLAGDYDAGAIQEQVFDTFRDKGLRVLAVEPRVPDHVLVASNRLPAALRDKLRQTLLHLQDQPEGRAILARLQPDFTEFVPARDSDYDALRRIMHATVPLAR